MVASVLTAAAASGWADSGICVPESGYQAVDRLAGRWPSVFAIESSRAVTFDTFAGLEWIDLGGNTIVADWGTPDDYLSMYTDPWTGYIDVWPSFITPDPLGDSLWVGFTVTGSTDDRIYHVDSSGNWDHRATLAGNYDLEFSGGNAFVSANPGAACSPYEPWNKLYLLDTTGNNKHDIIADIGGYSVGLGIQSTGDICFGTYYLTGDSDPFGPADDAMYRFSAAQIASAIGPGQLSLNDAEELFTLEAGPYDVDVDAGDHLVFSTNTYGVGSWVSVWDEGSEADPMVIAHSAHDSSWFTALGVAGDVLETGGAAFALDWYHDGIAQIVNPLLGDADLDGDVDERDASILALHWKVASGVDWADGDFNGDRRVDERDASIVASHWHQGVVRQVTAAIPEPSSGRLAGLGLLLLAARGFFGCRRRSASALSSRTRGY